MLWLASSGLWKSIMQHMGGLNTWANWAMRLHATLNRLFAWNYRVWLKRCMTSRSGPPRQVSKQYGRLEGRRYLGGGHCYWVAHLGCINIPFLSRVLGIVV